MKSKLSLVILWCGLVAMGTALNAGADVGVNIRLWQGYGSYLANVGLTADNPAPITYHRIESPSGFLWHNRGSNNDDSGFFFTNHLAGLVHEITNGIWKLFINKDDASAEVYFFSVSISGVASNDLGDVVFISPPDGGTVATNPPEFQWAGPTNFPQIYLWTSHEDEGNSYSTDSSGSATNWTPPGPLTPGPNFLYVQYYHDAFPGFSISTPTNELGTPLAGWSGQGDLLSYRYLGFIVGGDSELGEAVDASHLIWTTGGDTNWFVQTNETWDGEDAAQSGQITHDQSSWIETSVEGPGTLSFWWNVDSENDPGYDYLEFTVDGNYEADISGNSGWDYYEVEIGPGVTTLRWTYWKDSDNSIGRDAAWLDQVYFEPAPVAPDVEIKLIVERFQNPGGSGYAVFPFLAYVSIPASTTHEVESPNNLFSGSESGSGSTVLGTLPEVIQEMEAGDWRLYINRGDDSEQVYYFTASVSGLDTNLLSLPAILSPTNGSSGVSSQPVFSWSGPAHFSELNVQTRRIEDDLGGGLASLPATATTWTNAPALLAGTNFFEATYTSNAFHGISFSLPVDVSTNPIGFWYTEVDLRVIARSEFVVTGAPPPGETVLLSPQQIGTNFVISLLTQTGRTHVIERQAKIDAQTWSFVTNIAGDGLIQTISLPIGPEPEQYYRAGTQ